MSMQSVTRYRKLFEVKILHHYWLDDGATVFDLIADPQLKNQRLQQYDVRRLLNVTATPATEQLLRGIGGKFQTTAHGFIVAVPDDCKLAVDALLEFAVTVSDSRFFDYTALGLLNRGLVEYRHPEQAKRYRYKRNVLVFGNRNGDVRGSQLFLSQPLPKLDADDSVEALVQSGNALKQLISDQPGGQSQTLNASYKKLPAYAHQGDIPQLTPPEALNVAPLYGIELTPGLPEQLFALIRIQASRSDKPAFSIVDNNGLPKAQPPLFEIRFRNRSTFRRYINKQTGAVISIDSSPTPLTFFGNAGSGQKPQPAAPRIIRNGSRITQLVSDIPI